MAEDVARVSEEKGIGLPMPKMSDFMILRENKNNWFVEFVDRFVRVAVGAKKFDTLSVQQPMSTFVMVGDEAFALLIFENQEERWADMLQRNSTKSDKAAKCTDGGNSKNGTGRSRKAKGWDPAGLQRFNELFQLVKLDRMQPHAMEFETNHQLHQQQKKENSKKRKAAKRQMKECPTDGIIVDSVCDEMDAEMAMV